MPPQKRTPQPSAAQMAEYHAAVQAMPALQTAAAQMPSINKEVLDSQGKHVLTIWSNTGDPVTPAAFDAAIQTYDASGKAPEGFTVLPPGIQNFFRGAFEAQNQPVQQASRELDSPDSRVNQLPAPLASAAKFALRMPSEAVKTPSRAALTLATGAVAPLLPAANAARMLAPTARQIAAAAAKGVPALERAALSVPRLITAATASGTAGASAAALARAATGEPQDLGQTALEFGIAAMGGSFQSVLQHYATRYIPAQRQEQFLGDIVDTFRERYPALANDPHILDMAVSSKEKLAYMTHRMAAGLREGYDDVTSTMIQDINQMAPRSLNTAQQATLRSKMRDLDRAANDTLNNVLNTAPGAEGALSGVRQAEAHMDTVVNDIIDYVSNAFPTAKANPQIIADVTNTLARQMTALNHFKEGAQVLGLMRESGSASGFSPMAFSNVIRDRYQADPGSLLHRVGNILGGGRALTEMPRGTTLPAPGPGDELLKVAKGLLPRSVQWATSLMKPTAGPATPWPNVIPKVQLPSSIAAQQAGQDAMISFIDRNKGTSE
jgi:hypothetical protein